MLTGVLLLRFSGAGRPGDLPRCFLLVQLSASGEESTQSMLAGTSSPHDGLECLSTPTLSRQPFL